MDELNSLRAKRSITVQEKISNNLEDAGYNGKEGRGWPMNEFCPVCGAWKTMKKNEDGDYVCQSCSHTEYY